MEGRIIYLLCYATIAAIVVAVDKLRYEDLVDELRVYLLVWRGHQRSTEGEIRVLLGVDFRLQSPSFRR
jgi:hypothetical protein